MPSRVHRVTHPIIGVATWREIQRAAADTAAQRGEKICTWCHKPVPKGKRTQCGAKACTDGITAACDWGTVRGRILTRDRLRCTLCGSEATEVDHIVPVCKGGTSDPDNLRALCHDCHRSVTTALARQLAADRRPRPGPPHPALELPE